MQTRSRADFAVCLPGPGVSWLSPWAEVTAWVSRRSCKRSSRVAGSSLFIKLGIRQGEGPEGPTRMRLRQPQRGFPVGLNQGLTGRGAALRHPRGLVQPTEATGAVRGDWGLAGCRPGQVHAACGSPGSPAATSSLEL